MKHIGFSLKVVLLDAPPLQSIANMPVSVTLGGATLSFTFDPKGKGKITLGTLASQFIPPVKHGATFQGGAIALTVVGKNGSWASA